MNSTGGKDIPLPWIGGTDGSLLLKVKASPGSKREGISGVHGDALKIAVTAPPEKGKANRAVVEVLARALGLVRRDVAVESGATSREKRIRIGGIGRSELEARLAKLLLEP